MSSSLGADGLRSCGATASHDVQLHAILQGGNAGVRCRAALLIAEGVAEPACTLEEGRGSAGVSEPCW